MGIDNRINNVANNVALDNVDNSIPRIICLSAKQHIALLAFYKHSEASEL